MRVVAYRLLDSASEAEEAVQEAWLRLSRADPRDVDNLRGWLTTVVVRVALDLLRARVAAQTPPLTRSLTCAAGRCPTFYEMLLADGRRQCSSRYPPLLAWGAR
jgi:DNA-directed RNA polymerase specialized sigma24 family protein